MSSSDSPDSGADQLPAAFTIRPSKKSVRCGTRTFVLLKEKVTSVPRGQSWDTLNREGRVNNLLLIIYKPSGVTHNSDDGKGKIINQVLLITFMYPISKCTLYKLLLSVFICITKTESCIFFVLVGSLAVCLDLPNIDLDSVDSG